MRRPQPGVWTEILSHDGTDLAAALQTIREDEGPARLDEAIEQIFPGSELHIIKQGSTFGLSLDMPGIMRPLEASEFSDGTLRYLCLLAALMSRSPAQLLVLNEPENSLHPSVLGPLAKLIIEASERSQVWVTTHSTKLAEILATADHAKSFVLEIVDGETSIVGQGLILE
jgi:predicted ATPase